MFAYAAAQVKHMLEVTQRLGGENYVLWGGREGYDTLLNTDLKREGAQLARFLHLAAEHKHKIGFTGQLLIEPKPMEPTKHQYDYDVGDGLRLPRRATGSRASTRQRRGQPRDAGRPLASTTRWRTPTANGMLGSIDANRGDPQNGWDTDQFPNSVEDLTMPLYEILRQRRARAGRLQLRRQAPPPEHRPHGPLPRPHRRRSTRWPRRSSPRRR